MKKRFLSLLLALFMLLSLLPTAAFAAVRDGDDISIEAPAAAEDAAKPAQAEVPAESVETADDQPAALAEGETDPYTYYDYTKTTPSAPSYQKPSGENSPSAAVDNDTGTWYHSAWNLNQGGAGPTNLTNDEENRYIQLTLEETTTIAALRYLARSKESSNGDYGNGVVKGYQVWVSTNDTVTAGSKDGFTKVAEGTWPASDNTAWQLAEFSTPVSAKHVRLYGTDTHVNGTSGSNQYISAAEIRLITEINRPTPDGNLCRPSDGVSVTATCSNTEESGHTADKVIDGDTSSNASRWTTVSDGAGTTERWIKLDLGAQRSFSRVNIYWNELNATNYVIETSPTGADGSWTPQVTKTEKPDSSYMVYRFSSSVQARYVRLRVTAYDHAAGLSNWFNVSVYEIEVYRDDAAVPVPTVAELANQLIPTYVAAEVDTPARVTYSRPGGDAIPAGYSVTVAANLEQVVGANGTVYTPLVNTPVEIAFTVTNADGEHATTSGSSVHTLTIPGAHTSSDGTNPKPAVIPEIMEWYSSADQNGKKFTLTEYSRIIHRFGHDGGFDHVADELTADINDLFDLGMTTAKNHVHDKQDYASIAAAVQPGDIVIYNVLPTGTAYNRGLVAGFDDETYRMEISNTVTDANGNVTTQDGAHITIYATDATGAYWATRTLLQALKLSQAANNGLTIDCGTIRDYPEFKVRGFILDVGRKPMSMDKLREIAKNMAWYKMNDFHVHLNDNLIFLEDYISGQWTNPTEYAKANNAYSAFRLESSIPEEPDAVAPLAAKDYHYTKAEYKAFVEDSAKIGVNIVSEIDVPAHAKAITDAFPSVRLFNANGMLNHPYNDHLDLTGKYDASMSIIKQIFDEYIDEGVFGSSVHFGADEYYDSHPSYRRYVKDMIDYLNGKASITTKRVWGSLTKLSDNPTQYPTSDINTEGVQMNVWNTTWANPQAMYDLGFDLINCLDGSHYMVPYSGYYHPNGLGDGGYSWDPNNFGGTWIPAASSQMSGGAYAIWNDMIDTRANGVDEQDLFQQFFFEPLPYYACALWSRSALNSAAMSKAEAKESIDVLSYAPNTNPANEAECAGDKYFDYSFDQDGADSSDNHRDLTLHGGASVQNGLLSLSAGESYADLGIDKLGWGNQLSFKVMKLPSSSEEEVLFESDPAYGDFAIKALPGADADHWRLGFSRELYDYEFPVDLPVGDWVQLSLVNLQGEALLSVDGDPYINAVGKFVSDETSNTAFRGKTGITRSSLTLPLARIGSKTNSFVGYLDDVTAASAGDIVRQRTLSLTATAPSEANKGSDGPAANVVDGDPNTYWHSRYNNCDNGKGEETLTDQTKYVEVILPTGATVTGLRHRRRPGGGNGTVSAADIKVSTTTSTEGSDAGFDFVTSVTGWGSANTYDEVTFDTPQENVKFVRLYGTTTTGGFMSAAEVEPIYTIPLTAETTTLTLLAGSENWKVSGRPHLTVFRQADTQPALFLTEGTDYTLSYSDAAPGETCTITLTGMGHYTGEVTATYTVPASSAKTSIEDATVTFDQESYHLENGKAEPKPVVKVGDTTLLEGLDYTLSYANNTAVGTATVTVTGIGDYEGTTTATFTVTPEIVKKNLSNAAKTKVTLHQLTFLYEGAAITPDPVVTYDGETLVKGKDYTVSYAHNNAVGTATVTVTGLAPYCEGSASTTFTIVDPASLKDLSDVEKTKVTFNPSEYAYTGKPIVPTFTVRYGGLLLTEGKHYSVELSNNVNGGNGVLVIRGISDGGYVGPFVTTFTITGGGTTKPSGNTSGSSSSSSTTTTSKREDGSSMTTRTDASGAKTATATYSDGSKVTADIPVDGPITAVVTVPQSVDQVTVTIPTRTEPTQGQIAVILHPDGTEEIVKTALPNADGLAVTLADSATIQVVDNTKEFVDVADDNWAKDAITFVTSREIFNGTGSNTFSPAGDMSRAMVCTVLANLAGENTKDGATWYEKGLAWAQDKGISDGTAPHAIITREQLAAMLYRYAGSPEVEMTELDFTDSDTVSSWAAQAMSWAVQTGLLKGRNGTELAPQATATRAEVATIFQRYVSLLAK